MCAYYQQYFLPHFAHSHSSQYFDALTFVSSPPTPTHHHSLSNNLWKKLSFINAFSTCNSQMELGKRKCKFRLYSSNRQHAYQRWRYFTSRRHSFLLFWLFLICYHNERLVPVLAESIDQIRHISTFFFKLYY